MTQLCFLLLTQFEVQLGGRLCRKNQDDLILKEHKEAEVGDAQANNTADALQQARRRAMPPK